MKFKTLPLYLPYVPYAYKVDYIPGRGVKKNGVTRFVPRRIIYSRVENYDYHPKNKHYIYTSNQSRIVNRRNYIDTYGFDTARQVAEVNYRYKMADKRDNAIRRWIAKWKASRPPPRKRHRPINKRKRSVD